MTCEACGRVNASGNRFCGGCGAMLACDCPACGRVNPPDNRFCGGCGARLDPSADAAGSARGLEPAGAARKVVTIVFADLVGSTALHERLDAEAVRQFMAAYYAAMCRAVEAHGGRVTQLMGDGVKAVFGAPRIAEDDALRAVRAAVEMQRAFRDLAAQQQIRVGRTGLRIAVNTGEVVAEEGHEIIGDPVNVAARLQERGEDGDVVIGGATQRLVAAQVTLERLGSFALKGRAEAVEAYRVVSLTAPVRAASLEFVGRDDELFRLHLTFESAVAAPATTLAVVLASPGVGKSRLMAELCARLGRVATILTAHCEATAGATFAPLAQAIRAFLAAAGGATKLSLADVDVLPALEAVLPADMADRARVVAGLASLFSGTPAPPEESFFVVRRFLATLAADKPVVLAIDDLHWAEPLLLDLIEHLVQWDSGVPLLVVAGARPELRERRPSLFDRGGGVFDVITLGGLDAGAATRLAAGVLGAPNLPAPIAAKVLAASEGNPLFVAELVRMLVQDGVLVRDGERWTVGAAHAVIEMPPTIHALLAARVERLRPEDSFILERAAIIGRRFTRGMLAAMLPEAVRDLDERLESLRGSELIERDSAWLFGEPALRFHHALIRDAAYRRLLKGTRAELHERLAVWIEARDAGAAEHDETIGYHLEQAYHHLNDLGAVDARGSYLGEMAARRLGAAGQRALSRDDVPMASGLLGRAVACLDRASSQRPELLLQWCEALLSAGDVAAAAAAIDDLGELAAATPSDSPGKNDSSPPTTEICDDAGARGRRLCAWHACFAGQLASLTASLDLQRAIDDVEAAAEELAALGDAAGEAKAHSVRAQVLARLGKIGACEAAFDRALTAARRAGDRRRAQAVFAEAPVAALWGPSPVARASGRCLDVVRVLRITQGAPGVEAIALSCQGVLEALRGRIATARRLIGASREMVAELGIAHRLHETDVLAARVDLLEGDAVAASRRLTAAYRGLRDLGFGIDAARAAALLGRALLLQGRVAEAESLSRESEHLAGNDLQAAIAWRGVRAEAMARRGENAAAVEIARAGVAIAAATDALLDHAGARMALAATLRAVGREAEAAEEEARAVGLWASKGATLLADRAAGGERLRSADAPGGSVVEAGPSLRRVAANCASAAMSRIEAAFACRDLASIGPFADSFEEIHCATGTSCGHEAMIAAAARFLELPGASVSYELLATIGDTLCLFRRWMRSGADARGRVDVDGYQRAEVGIFAVDDQGRLLRSEIFAADRLGEATTRFYEVYAELLPAGPERVHAAGVARAGRAVLAMADPEKFALALDPDLHAVDHRNVGYGVLRGRQQVVESLRTLIELTQEIRWRVDDVFVLTSTALLLRATSTGVDRAGGAFERANIALFVFAASGLVHRWEQFEVDQVAAAFARLDALGDEAATEGDASAPASGVAAADREEGPVAAPRKAVASNPPRIPANAVTRVSDRLWRAARAGDVEAVRQLCSPSMVFEDRRRNLRMSGGRDAFIASLQISGSSKLRLRRRRLAGPNQRLALEYRRWRRIEEVVLFEIECLTLTQIDAERRIEAVILFDPDDRPAADRELAERVLRTDGESP